MARSKNRPSVLNWLGSLILCSIPGINIIFLILTIVFARTPAKRNFAIAGLLLLILFAALVFAGFALFPDQINQFADYLLQNSILLVRP